MRILKIKNWRTKASEYPTIGYGSAKIERVTYESGYYLMEGVAGYDLYYLENPIKVTELLIDGDIVMVDDPLHWIGMMKLAEACEGRTLVGGLGLGLILHHLANNEDVTQIDVVEINPDVIHLIKPYLPKDPRVNIICDDVFKYKYVHGKYDTIVLDLWVKNEKMEEAKLAGTNDTKLSPLEAYVRFQYNNPDANVYVWGLRHPAINPAVKKLSKDYIKLLRHLDEFFKK
jgi:hypothetical protein